jgi:hypothetical protein
MNWPREEIPDADALFMRVHRCFLQYGEIIPGVFKDHGDRNGKGGMSTDWEKYSTPVATRNRARRPEDNGVISFNAGQVRAISGLTVNHSPDLESCNRAHTDIRGEKTPEVRLKLQRIFKLIISIPIGTPH